MLTSVGNHGEASGGIKSNFFFLLLDVFIYFVSMQFSPIGKCYKRERWYIGGC